MITDYNDPIVTLTQTYKTVSNGVQPLLGACIIGPNYVIRDYEHDGIKLDLTSFENYGEEVSQSQLDYTYQNGLTTRSIPMLYSNNSNLDENSLKILVKQAQIEYLSLTQSNSITFAQSRARIKSSEFLSGEGRQGVDVEVGDIVQVTLIESSTEISQSITVRCYVSRLQADAYNNYKICLLSKSLYSDQQTNVRISKVSFRKTIDCYVHQDYVTLSNIQGLKKVKIQKQAYSTAISINGEKEAQYSIYAGKFYAEYRYISKQFTQKYGMLSNQDDVQDVLGVICPQNPLAIAVSSALSQSNNRFVYFVALQNDYTDDKNIVIEYQKAFSVISSVQGIHGIVPCTSNVQVIKVGNSFVNKESAQDIPYFKFLYASCDIPQRILLNTIDIKVKSVQKVDKNTKITFTEDALLYNKSDIQQGDFIQVIESKKLYQILSTNYRNYVIIKGDQTSNIEQNNSINIFDYTLSATQKTSYIIQNKAISDKRTAIVFADTARYKGFYVPNYVVAAALAGRRSSSYPHAPLSNIQMQSITTLQLNNLTTSQYKQLGAYGFWRVAQNTQGQTMSLRQLTSAAADDVNLDQQSIICSVDSVCLGLKFVGRNLVGNSNISQTLLVLLQTAISSKLLNYMQYIDDYIGPQLLQAKLVSIEQDSIFLDRVYASIDVTPPKPFNKFHMTVRLT